MKKVFVTLSVGLVSLAILSPSVSFATENLKAGELKQGYDASEKKVEATTYADFAIDQGKLTLDKVPDFHFTKEGTNNPEIADIENGIDLILASGTVGQASKDGSDRKELIVSDYRGSKTGWNLSVSVGEFVNTADTDVKLTGVSLAFNPTADEKSAASSPVTVAAGSSETLINAVVGKGTLTNTYTFDKATKLKITDQDAKAGTYQSTLTWDLTNAPK